MLSACSPVIAGVVGLTTTESGELRALAHGCGEQPGLASLDREVETRDSSGWEEVAWGWVEAQGDPTEYSLRTAEAEADPKAVAASSLGADDWYEVLVSTDDINVNVGSLDFSGADLERIEPGEVLVHDRAERPANAKFRDHRVLTVVSRDVFDARACDDEW